MVVGRGNLYSWSWPQCFASSQFYILLGLGSFENKSLFSLILCCNLTSSLSTFLHLLEFIGLTSHWPFATSKCLFHAFLSCQFGTPINVLHYTIVILCCIIDALLSSCCSKQPCTVWSLCLFLKPFLTSAFELLHFSCSHLTVCFFQKDQHSPMLHSSVPSILYSLLFNCSSILSSLNTPEDFIHLSCVSIPSSNWHQVFGYTIFAIVFFTLKKKSYLFTSLFLFWTLHYSLYFIFVWLYLKPKWQKWTDNRIGKKCKNVCWNNLPPF